VLEHGKIELHIKYITDRVLHYLRAITSLHCQSLVPNLRNPESLLLAQDSYRPAPLAEVETEVGLAGTMMIDIHKYFETGVRNSQPRHKE
jgi:hypothetical protein